MAERTMKRAVVKDGVRYVPDQDEDLLARVLTSDEVKRLSNREVLTGDWTGVGEGADEDEEEEVAPDRDMTQRANNKAKRRRRAMRKRAKKRAKRRKKEAMKGREKNRDDVDLPADIPGREELIEAGYTDEAKVMEAAKLDALTDVRGIGSVTAEKIREHYDIEAEGDEGEEE